MKLLTRDRATRRPRHDSIHRLLAIAVLALVTVGRSIAQADLPQPRLTSLSRAGARVGEPVDVTLRGTDLEGAKDLWFDHPGIRATHVKDATFRVIASPDVTLGHHDVRAVGLYGVTNPRTFVIGDRPELIEIEPNDVSEKAMPVASGIVMNGELTSPTDVDLFALDGKRGQRVILDLEAERIESRLDATVRILKPNGAELAESRDVYGVDPFLDVTLPADGRYLIKVHDAIFAGSPDHGYRLTISDGPHLDAILPRAAQTGSAVPFTLIGRGLGAGVLTDAKLKSDGVALERMMETISPPADFANSSATGQLTRVFVPASAAGTRSGFVYRFVRSSPEGRMPVVSNAIFIDRAAGTVVVEAEPNAEPAHAQAVVPPCDISGTFAIAGDVDLYQFAAKKGDVWWVEAFAERIGSQADPSFVIQKVEADGVASRDLATADDLPDGGLGPRFNIESSDAALRWQVPEEGLYRIALTDLFGSQRGQPRLAYRLVIRKPVPDFQVILVPENTASPDGLSLRPGGRAIAYALAIRKEGFSGPIRVEPRSLPPGVTAPAVTIADGQLLAPMVFEASPDAKPTVGGASFAAVGPAAPQTMVRPVAAGGMIWPPPSPTTSPTVAPARLFSDFVVAVLGDPAPLEIVAQPDRPTVTQGQRLNLDLTLTRRAGFVDAVTVTATDLPRSLTAASLTIPKDATRAVLPLFIPSRVSAGVFTILVRASGNFPFSKDPATKNKPNVPISTPSNPITVTIRLTPVKLTARVPQGGLKAGGTQTLDVVIDRQNGYKGPVSLTLSAPDSLKLIAKPAAVGDNNNSAKLVIQAAKDTPTGPDAVVYVQATVTIDGKPVLVEEPVALQVVK